jgi:uncharacterized membrane protein YsdA (DUF1294 family)
MDNITISMLLVLGLINLVSFSAMVYDKNLAITGQRRISEGALFFWAIMFGGLGIYLGMFVFRHKTRKWYFYFGIPLLLAQNAACFLLLYQFLKETCFTLG